KHSKPIRTNFLLVVHTHSQRSKGYASKQLRSVCDGQLPKKCFTVLKPLFDQTDGPCLTLILNPHYSNCLVLDTGSRLFDSLSFKGHHSSLMINPKSEIQNQKSKISNTNYISAINWH